MLTFHREPISIMVLFAVALHLFWSAALMIDRAALNATAINALARFVQPPALIALLIAVALMAMVGMLFRLPWWLLVPQQIVLMMSAAGAIEAMWLSQFADGVLRPAAFIAADQIYSVLAALGHTVALVTYSNRID